MRHAEPSATGVLLGASDPALSAAGRSDASRILAPTPLVYASPLRRAGETAARLQGVSEIQVLDELAEISYGEWDGMCWSAIEQKYPELAKQKLAAWLEVTSPQGEPWNSFAARVHKGFTRIQQRMRHSGESCTIVAHSAVNACIASKLTGVDPMSFHQNYTQVNPYEFFCPAGSTGSSRFTYET